MDRTERALHELGIDEALELLGLGAIMRDTAVINRKVNRIMASLQDLAAKFDTLKGDVTRALDDLRNAVERLNSGDLSPANQAVVDDLSAKLDELDTAVDAADPEPTQPVSPDQPV